MHIYTHINVRSQAEKIIISYARHSQREKEKLILTNFVSRSMVLSFKTMIEVYSTCSLHGGHSINTCRLNKNDSKVFIHTNPFAHLVQQ